MVNHSGYDVTEYLKVDENKLGFPSLSFNHSKAHPHRPTHSDITANKHLLVNTTNIRINYTVSSDKNKLRCAYFW